MNTEIDASLNEKVKATLLKGRSKQKETMNVYFLTQAPKSSTFFCCKIIFKKGK